MNTTESCPNSPEYHLDASTCNSNTLFDERRSSIAASATHRGEGDLDRERTYSSTNSVFSGELDRGIMMETAAVRAGIESSACSDADGPIPPHLEPSRLGGEVLEMVECFVGNENSRNLTGSQLVQ